MKKENELPLMILLITADERKKSNYDKFVQFHKDNPKIYKELVKWAMECKYTYNHTSIGFPLVWNIVRCLSQIQTKGYEAIEFKMNNIFAPFYSRFIMATQKDLKKFFAIRKSEADDYTYDDLDTGEVKEDKTLYTQE